jgi:hypothetical protein
MNLSQNFTLAELCKSELAIRRSIDNSPTQDVISNLQALVVNILQPVRNSLGPITINSGYRSPAVNVAVGGSRTSDHCKGMAADIEIAGYDNKMLAKFIEQNFRFTQVILEFYEDGQPSSGWVHVSFDPDNLKYECLRAVKQDGKTVYLKGF